MKYFIIKKVAISICLVIFLCFNNTGVLAICDELKGGTILHAWSWSFKTIKDNIQEIKDAGYDAIQVSPPQESYINRDCKKCNQEGKDCCTCFKENWYYVYQPTNFKIGNMLGTRDEFQEMCEIAQKNNIKIIVDIVANHVCGKLNMVSKDVYDPEKDEVLDVFHGINGNKHEDWRIHIDNDWENRYKIIYGSLYGLYDLNTGGERVQKMIKNYMNDCLKCGAWGFRYDAVKHIELPKEYDGNYGSDFWPNITKNAKDHGAKWQYGEILQDGNENVTKLVAYSKYMDITASDYGKKIRKLIRNKNLSHNDIMSYHIKGIEDNKLVTWVESHDNYANKKEFEGNASSFYMTDNDIKVGWAIIAGRAAGVPLFFSRPVGGGNGDQFPEKTKIGDKGSDLFKDPYIVAINKFRKAMKDKSEYLRSQNNKLLIIERGSEEESGNEGMIIINWSKNSEVSSETRLSDGIYIDAISKREFKVENKKIFGNTENEITILTKNGI